MAEACPVSLRIIDANVVRLNALSISILIGLFLYTQNIFIVYFVAFDFMTRLFIKPQYSSIFHLSRTIQKIFNIPVKKADAGPKRFAAKIGLSLSLLIIALYHLSLCPAPCAVAIIFVICTSLEVIFNYCLGCKFHSIFLKYGIIKP